MSREELIEEFKFQYDNTLSCYAHQVDDVFFLFKFQYDNTLRKTGGTK